MFKITQAEFGELTKYIKLKFGISLGEQKRSLVEGRMEKVLQKLGITDFTVYLQYLKEDKTGKADIALVNAITTNHTFFMRETDHFQYYAEVVLPKIVANINDGDLRTWCAACSSGEEAYTLAMMIKDFFVFKNEGWDTKVLATDISLTALGAARLGVYSNDAVHSLPSKWQKIYFQKKDDMHYQVKETLKSEVIFRQFNLINKEFPFKRKFHVIFCRNVMIYFDAPTRRELINKLYQSLEAGGYLFIGHSEVIDRNESLFNYVMPSVYRKE